VSTAHAPIRFADLDLEEPVRRGIEDAGFVECTPIQAATLPFALTGRDIAGQAQTGTGKTAAFLIATFNRLTRHPHRRQRPLKPRVLIIAPTRELVVQIHKDAELLGRHCDLTLHAVYGGVDYNKQLQKLKDGVDVLIGTPGRLIDYYKQRAYTLDAIEVVVIDEADRMFDMGFIDDIRYMLRKLPSPDRRQSFLYSATLSHRVLELAYEHMNEVERVAISENQVTAENVTQEVYHVGLGEKFSLLLGLLEREKPSRALVFVNTRGGAAWVCDRLDDHGHQAGALAGNIDQRKRLKLLEQFKRGELPILVATDVASRGLHIEQVSHVINYDLPQDPEDYVHRIGRTARAGASGKAISLACETYVYSLEAIEEFIGHKIPAEFADEHLLVATRAPSRRPARAHANGGPKGARHGSRRQRGASGASSGHSSRGEARGESRRHSSGEHAQAAGPAATHNATDGGDGMPKKKRRRRRRRRATPAAVVE
jgi:ATP-dependent RNA helicase RhlB